MGDRSVVYHYCDFGDTQSTYPATILRNLFIQLLVSSTVEWIGDFEDLVLRKELRQSPPSGLSDLATLIVRASRGHQQVIIAVDALDECLSKDRSDLLECLRDLSEKDGISVFVTSRREQDIWEIFHDLPFISLTEQEESIKGDIQTYIATQLRKDKNLAKFPDKVKDEISETLLKKADGMSVLV